MSPSSPSSRTKHTESGPRIAWCWSRVSGSRDLRALGSSLRLQPCLQPFHAISGSVLCGSMGGSGIPSMPSSVLSTGWGHDHAGDGFPASHGQHPSGVCSPFEGRLVVQGLDVGWQPAPQCQCLITSSVRPRDSRRPMSPACQTAHPTKATIAQDWPQDREGAQRVHPNHRTADIRSLGPNG